MTDILDDNKQVVAALHALGGAGTVSEISRQSGFLLPRTVNALDRLGSVNVITTHTDKAGRLIYELVKTVVAPLSQPVSDAAQAAVSPSGPEAAAPGSFASARIRVQQMLQNHPHGLTRQQLLQRTGETESRIDNILYQFREKGRITGGKGSPLIWVPEPVVAATATGNLDLVTLSPKQKGQLEAAHHAASKTAPAVIHSDFNCAIDAAGTLHLDLLDGQRVSISQGGAKILAKFLSRVQGVLNA